MGYLCKDIGETGGSSDCLRGGELDSRESGAGCRGSSISLSPCDVWTSYRVHIPLLPKKFIPRGQFSNQKVLKYPFYLMYYSSPSLEGPGTGDWDLGIGSSTDPAFWVLLPDSELTTRGQGAIALAVPGTKSDIFRDTDRLELIWPIIPSLLTYS